jgi:hypothetical protein
LNTVKRTTIFFLLLAMPVFLVPAQTSSTNTNNNFFDLSGAPQWVRDLRRWEIVAFGTIPFAMFTATFGMDMYRWNNANGMDFSDAGRKYAPWPLKSAGAFTMESQEMEQTLIIAASLCVSVAVADLIITLIKRHKAQKRAEALPHNATTINRSPLYEETPDEPEPQAPEVQDDAAGELEIPSTAAQENPLP